MQVNFIHQIYDLERERLLENDLLGDREYLRGE